MRRVIGAAGGLDGGCDDTFLTVSTIGYGSNLSCLVDRLRAMVGKSSDGRVSRGVNGGWGPSGAHFVVGCGSICCGVLSFC